MVGASQKNCTSQLELEPFTSPEHPRDSLHVRFVCISDTHSKHEWDKCPFTVPNGDVLLHAGDFTKVGDVREVAAFCKWFGALPHKRKILIAGNHDLSLHGETYAQTGLLQGLQSADAAELAAKARALVDATPNCEYLCDSGTSVRGISIWGSPWQPMFPTGPPQAFQLPRGQPLRDKWALIPEQTDVVVTHSPPLGHGDAAGPGNHIGCIDLLDELQSRVKPSHHVFGHCHPGYGVTSDGQTLFLNAATCTNAYRPEHLPLVFDLPARDEVPAGARGGCGSDGGGGDFLDRLAQAEVRDSHRALTVVERRLHEAFQNADAEGTGQLSVAQLRGVLVQSGESANGAKRLVEQYGKSGNEGGLDLESFVRAWQAEGFSTPGSS